MGEKYQENLEQLEAISEKLKEISVLLTNLSKASQLGQMADFVSIAEPLSRGLIGLRSINREVDKMWNKLLGKDEQFRQYGKYVGEGIVEGLKESLPNIKIITNQLGKKGIVKTFETTMDMHSPSKVMKRLGQYVVAGLGDGIEDKLRDIKKSMSKLTDAVLHHRISSQGFI